MGSNGVGPLCRSGRFPYQVLEFLSNFQFVPAYFDQMGQGGGFCQFLLFFVEFSVFARVFWSNGAAPGKTDLILDQDSWRPAKTSKIKCARTSIIFVDGPACRSAPDTRLRNQRFVDVKRPLDIGMGSLPGPHGGIPGASRELPGGSQEGVAPRPAYFC